MTLKHIILHLSMINISLYCFIFLNLMNTLHYFQNEPLFIFYILCPFYSDIHTATQCIHFTLCVAVFRFQLIWLDLQHFLIIHIFIRFELMVFLAWQLFLNIVLLKIYFVFYYVHIEIHLIQILKITQLNIYVL